MATKRILVRGQVQGVGFRMSMYYAATRLGLVGWVRNRRDGSVESLAQGDEATLKEFIDWAHKGPGLSQVDSVEVLEGTPDNYTQFQITDTL